MNNLVKSFQKIAAMLIEIGIDTPTTTQKRKPKLSDLEVIALNITAEYMSYNSELQLFRALEGTELEAKIERTVYNKRRRALYLNIEKARQTISHKISYYSRVFMVDSAPIPICKPSRAGRSSICATPDIRPEWGFCASQKQYYFGYKLHAVCDENSVIHSFDISPANVHDVNYLKDVRYNLHHCELIGDKGYISATQQADLFTKSCIKLTVPHRKNQQCPPAKLSKYKQRQRKRIETLFSQLNGQFSMNVNYAKSFAGFSVRILSKITALTMIQYLNLFVFNRNINNIKVNI